jgi:nucleotide-binding universal stress UspA family protein
MFERILVAVDGSAIAAKALDFAIERAKLHDSELTVVFAVNRFAITAATANPYAYVDPVPLFRALDAEADAVLAGASRRAREAGIVAKEARLVGFPPQAILSHAREARSDVIVMGTHGRRGVERLALGSTAEEVMRTAGVPVFAVPQRCQSACTGPLGHLLVAIDGSPAAEDALALACDVARSERARLTLCSVAEPFGFDWDDLDRDTFLRAEVEQRTRPLLDQTRARVASKGIAVDAELRQGVAADEIVASALRSGADCIVIGTHGRAGIPRFVLGSVAEGVLRTSPLPVCAVRHRWAP